MRVWEDVVCIACHAENRAKVTEFPVPDHTYTET